MNQLFEEREKEEVGGFAVLHNFCTDALKALLTEVNGPNLEVMNECLEFLLESIIKFFITKFDSKLSKLDSCSQSFQKFITISEQKIEKIQQDTKTVKTN